MFPGHPHHHAWGEAAIRLQLQPRATPSDIHRTNTIDGMPVNRWIQKPALSDDFTLTSDGELRPDLVAATCLSSCDRLLYDWAGNPAPQSLSFHIQDIYTTLKLLALPNGSFLYAADGRADWLELHVMMSALFKDQQATTLAGLALNTMSHELSGDRMLPASLLAARLCRDADAYVLLRQVGPGPAPVAPAELWQQLAGNHLLPLDKLEVLRTDHSIATFSWNKQIAGGSLPLAKDQLIASNDRNLIGTVWMKNANGTAQDAPVLKSFRRISPIDPATAVPGVPPLPKDAFAIAGDLSRAKGLIEQPFAFVALPDGRAIYLDSPHLTSEKQPLRCDFGTLAILNDPRMPWHDGLRSIFFENGVMSFAAREATRNAVAHFSSNWFCIDGLGIIVLSSSGQQRYRPHPLTEAGPVEQLLVLNHVSHMPEDLSPTALVFYPGSNWSKTRDAASRCTLQQPDASHFMVTLDDGKAITFDFSRNVISMQP